MSHQVLARKWRPRNFVDVVGQEHVVRALANALDTGRIHHAYLFTGTRGVGKTTLARILAKALNCLGIDGRGGMTSTPCGVCQSCKDIDAGRFVDLLEVDAATNTKVDEMRELLETAQYAPVSGRYKVYIIDEVHMLSKQAFNAMLKTLEEPPAHVEFILATTDPQKLPITVLSRCLQFNLKNLSPTLLAEHLAHILQVEKVPFEQPALEMIGRAGEGSARDALSLLDQAIAYGAGEVKTDQVATMLGVLDQTYLFSMLSCLVAADAKALLAEISGLGERNVSFELTLKDLASVLSRVALVQSAGVDAVEGPDAPKIAAVAGQLTPDDVQLFYQISLLGRRDLALAPDEQSGFTMTLLRMLAFKNGEGAAQLAGHSTDSTLATTQKPRPAATAEAIPSNAPADKAFQQYAVETPAVARVSESQSPTPSSTHPSTLSSISTPLSALPSAPTPMLTHAAFDGDWPAFVVRQNFTGMASMLAKQVEFQSFKDGLLVLGLADAHKHLALKAYQEKLKEALAASLGKNLRLMINVDSAANEAAGSGNSVAAQEDRTRTREQAAAESAIDQDPFVKNLKQDFGADVNRATIRPAP